MDDEAINRKILGHILERDYNILYAKDGIEAYEIIEKEYRNISLIMLDLLMPGMDGYQVLEKIQENPEYKKIPVVILTSEASSEVRCLKMGALDFIRKPYESPEIIIARVERLIDYVETNSMVKEIENNELTGLYSLKFFYQYVKKFDVYNYDISMDAVIINVRRFHIINEIFGRDIGDEILKRIANELMEYSKSRIALLGKGESDNFYLYVNHQESYDDLINQIEGKLNTSIDELKLSIRLGIYSNADKNIDIEKRFDRALHACNSIREYFSENYSYYNINMFNDELFNDKLTSLFNDAIKNKEFKIYFQPKYSIQGDKPVCKDAEALVRWVNPIYGLINPGKFISLYENNGLITKLDRYVFEETVKLVKMYHDKYKEKITVSINLSRVDLYDLYLKDKLLEILKRYQMDPKYIHIEITESAFTKNAKLVNDQISNLKNAGFKIEIDDFGTGYSALSMLTKLPFDVLKLDMSFIRDIDNSDRTMRIVEVMIELAKYLNVAVVAEGVETETQYMKLKKAGCDMIQGYYFSKPLPNNEFEKLLGEKYGLK